jgi:hypothetical protein
MTRVDHEHAEHRERQFTGDDVDRAADRLWRVRSESNPAYALNSTWDILLDEFKVRLRDAGVAAHDIEASRRLFITAVTDRLKTHIDEAARGSTH